MHKLSNPPVFVCGAQRSGTTLIVRIISSAVEVDLFPQETHLYPLLWKPAGKLPFSDNRQLCEFLREGLPRVNYGWTLPEHSDYLDKLLQELGSSSERFRTTGSLLHFFLAYHLRDKPGLITGEKTPAHIYYYRQILKSFPGASFVIPVRDPRASALSEKVKLEDNDRMARRFRLMNFAARWLTANELALRMKQELGESRVHILRYEDLILEPEESIQAICRFLGVGFVPDMMETGVINSSFKDKLQTSEKFNAANLSRWKEGLDTTEIAGIQQILGDTMRKFGYAFEEGVKGLPVGMKDRMKLRAADLACTAYPAVFHHLNRHEKYKASRP